MTKRRKVSHAQRKEGQGIILFGICIAFLLVAIVAGCGQIGTGPDDSKKAAIREVRETAAAAAELLDVYMDARVTDMLVCSKLGGPLQESLTMPEARANANRILEEWLKISGAYDAILVLDKTGVCLASAPAGLVNQDFSNDIAFKGAVKGQLTIIDAHKSVILTTLDPKSKGWTAVIAVPLKLENEVAGVLMSCVNLSKLRALLMSIRIGTPFVQEYPTGRAEIWTGSVFVSNQKNQMIIHPIEEYCGRRLDEIGVPPEIRDAIKKRATDQRYVQRDPITGHTERYLAGFAYPKGYGNFPGLGWVVLVNVAEEQLIVAPWWMRLFR